MSLSELQFMYTLLPNLACGLILARWHRYADYMARRKKRLDKSLANDVNLEGLDDVM